MNIIARLSSIINAFLLFVAQTGVGTNSIWFLYEPEVPKSLKK